MSVKVIFIVTGILIFIIFAIPVLLNIINPGNTAGMLAGTVIIITAVLHKPILRTISNLWSHGFGKVIIILFSSIIIISFIYALVLTVFIISAREDKPEAPAAVIVLGCKVKEDRPSKMLKRRLNAAVTYLKENSEIVCIVTGGKGDDENIEEAEVMRKYLIDNGISPERIIKEDKSKSTYENLKNAFALYNIEPGREVTIVTDGFHQYRAGYIAKQMGYNTTAVNPAPTINGVLLAPTYTVREWMAITNEYRKALFKAIPHFLKNPD